MIKVAYIVISCGKYSDLWKPFFLLQEKFWPEISNDLFLATDSDYPASNLPDDVTLIDYGHDGTWSFNVRRIFQDQRLVVYDHVFLLMEDGFFNRRVDHEKIMSLFRECLKYDYDFFTLLSDPKCHEKKYKRFGVISKNSAYRTTATSALWKKNILLELLDDNESAWEFEKKGARRSEKYSNFYSCYEDEVSLIHMVVKGQFVRGALEELEKIGVAINSERRTISVWFTLRAIIYSNLRSLIFKLTPIKFHKYLVRNS